MSNVKIYNYVIYDYKLKRILKKRYLSIKVKTINSFYNEFNDFIILKII